MSAQSADAARPRHPGTRPVGRRHRFDEAALESWLRGRLADFRGPMRIRQFEGGQSNPTFLLETETGVYVLRKKPPGALLPSAHAIDREYRVLEALAGSAAPVPAVRCYCDDDAVIGTPFYLMDYRPGRIFTDPLLPGQDADARKALYDAMNEALARIHAVDWRAAGLGDFGKPEDYFARQVGRWSRQYEQIRTEVEPHMDALRNWLQANIPAGDDATIVHGDFRIGNLIFHPQKAEVVAILDWELSTIGHPLADLAFNCMTYHLPAGHPIAAGFVGVDIDALGIPSEEEYLASYARRTHRDPSPLWRFCMAFSLYRTAAIQHGVYARAVQGNASADNALVFGESYRRVAVAGWKVACAG